jgi:hypothetical protein
MGGGGGKSKNKYRAGETEKDRAYQRYSVREIKENYFYI